MAFRSANYWDILATLAVLTSADGPRTFNATLTRSTASGSRPARTRADTGRPRSGVVHLDEDGARGSGARLAGRRSRSPGSRRSPTGASRTPRSSPPPCSRSARKMRFASAQDDAHGPAALRERLHHLYAYRLVNLSESAIAAARTQIATCTATRPSRAAPSLHLEVKNAQEAHEAIRPPVTPSGPPVSWPRSCPTEEFKLYELIWRRTVASQMTTRRLVGVGADPGHLDLRRGVRLRRVRQDRSPIPVSCGPTSSPPTNEDASRGRRAPAAQPGQGPSRCAPTR